MLGTVLYQPGPLCRDCWLAKQRGQHRRFHGAAEISPPAMMRDGLEDAGNHRRAMMAEMGVPNFGPGIQRELVKTTVVRGSQRQNAAMGCKGENVVC